MNDYERVKEWHLAFGVPIHTRPIFPHDRVKMRLELIREEFIDELIPAVEQQNMIEIADALGDLSYVINGMAIEMGIDLPAVVAEIHHSNMTKLDENGDPILREDGKILKGPNWQPPNLMKVLFPQGVDEE